MFTSFTLDLSNFVVSNVPIILPMSTLLVPTFTIVPYALITSCPPITEYCCNKDPFVNVAA